MDIKKELIKAYDQGIEELLEEMDIDSLIKMNKRFVT